MRAFSAVTNLRCDEALSLLQKLQSGKPQEDSPAVMGPALASYCAARVGRRYEMTTGPKGLDPTVARERIYWTASAALQRSDWQAAYSQASAGLTLLGNRSNDELRWRLATISAIAARRLGNESIVAGLINTARTALDRVEAHWQADFASYRQRPDLVDLIRRAEQK